MQPNRPSSADAAMYGLHQRVQTTLHTSGLHANYRVLQSPSSIVKLVARATLYPRLSINLKRDSWSLSLVFVYIMTNFLQIRSGRARWVLHEIRSLLFQVATPVPPRVMGSKKCGLDVAPET